MKFATTLLTLASAITTALAAPAPLPAPAGSSASYALIYLISASLSNSRSYDWVPLDGSTYPIYNTQSISTVCSYQINVKDRCTLTTMDKNYALADLRTFYWNIGPPQVVTAISCRNA